MFDRTNELLASIDHSLQLIASNLNVMVKIMDIQLREKEGKGRLCPTPPPPPRLLPVPPPCEDDVIKRGWR